MPSIDGIEINTLFTKDDITGYEMYKACDCPLCKEGKPVDAVSNGYGYSAL